MAEQQPAWNEVNQQCIESGGHYWNNPEPGASSVCTRCARIGALNWPVLNESSDRSADDTSREALIESMCVTMHDAYEAAAVREGWQTQERSRKPWADVPDANKATMRAAVGALHDAVVTPLAEERDRLRATIARAPGFYEAVDTDTLRADRDAAIATAEAAERRLAVARERRDHWRRRFTDTAARATGLALNTHAATKTLDEYLAASDDDPHSTHDERCHERHERCLAHRVRNTLNPGDNPGKE